MSAQARPGPPGGRRRPVARWTAQLVILFLLWLALSGRLELEFLLLGGLAAALVVYLTSHLFAPSEPGMVAPLPQSPGWWAHTIIRFLAYFPWLLVQILLANLHVTYLILHPRLPIDPRLVQFDTPFKTEASQVLLAQSITLTPGTITINVEAGRYLVHALSPTSSQGLASGAMQRRVAAVFGEPPPPPQPLRTVTRLEEMES